MADADHLWTAAELERLSPAERQRILDERIVTDLSTLSPEFVAEVRQRAREIAEERGLLPPDGSA